MRRALPYILVVAASWGGAYLSADYAGDTAADQEARDLETCQAANDARSALRSFIRDQLVTVRATDPELFPDIPPRKFEQLIDERVDGYRASISELAPRDCA